MEGAPGTGSASGAQRRFVALSFRPVAVPEFRGSFGSPCGSSGGESSFHESPIEREAHLRELQDRSSQGEDLRNLFVERAPQATAGLMRHAGKAGRSEEPAVESAAGAGSQQVDSSRLPHRTNRRHGRTGRRYDGTDGLNEPLA